MQKKFLIPGALLALSFGGAGWAQGPVGDQVNVTFNRPVQVGSHTLDAGEYTIRQLTSASNPRVLEFTSDHGTKLNATVTAIPIMQNTPPSETRLVFEDEGSVTPRLHRIWVQGKTYGYEFPGASAPAPAPVATTTTVNLEARFEAQAPPVQAQVAPTPAPAPPPREEPRVIAQAPPPAPAPEPAPAPAPETPAPAPTVPATGLGWGDILLAGLSVAGAGLFLYRRTA